MMDCVKILDSFLRFVSYESGLVIEDCGEIIPELAGNYIVLPESTIDQMQEALCDLYPDKANHIRKIFNRAIEDEVRGQVILPVINQNSTYTELLIKKYGGVKELLSNYDSIEETDDVVVTEPISSIEEKIEEEGDELTEMERKELEDLKALLEVKNAEVEDLNKQLSSKDTEIVELKDKIKEHEEIVTTKDETISYLNEQVRELESKNEIDESELMSDEDIVEVFKVVSQLPDTQVTRGLKRGVSMIQESEDDTTDDIELIKLRDDKFFIVSEMLKGLAQNTDSDFVMKTLIRMFEDVEFNARALGYTGKVSSRDAFLTALRNLNEKEDTVGMTRMCMTLYRGLIEQGKE